MSNKETALKFMASMGAGQMDMSLATDDIQWWVPGRGLMSKAEFFELARSEERRVGKEC